MPRLRGQRQIPELRAPSLKSEASSDSLQSLCCPILHIKRRLDCATTRSTCTYESWVESPIRPKALQTVSFEVWLQIDLAAQATQAMIPQLAGRHS